jgi:hypothetical protein
MIRRNKKHTPFRSFTEIHNYNQFLLKLETEQYINHNSSINDPVNEPTSTMNDILNHVDKIYGIYPEITSITNPQFLPNEPIVNAKTKAKAREKVNINAEITNIQDLIKLTDTYPDDPFIDYNINISILHKIRIPLIQLNNMIGMVTLKENIVDQILYYIQSLNDKSSDFMHTVIYGPPGTGKTEVAKIMGDIFSKIGILNKGTFKKVTRTDLVAGYLGQTALKTSDVIKSALGGVLFIDEAYALGSSEKRDSFSKECIDTLCEALSDHKDKLMVIIAGYETELNECFFKSNQGLSSRFTWRFTVDEYTGSDLYNIFIKKVQDINWKMEPDNITSKWFETNKKHFKYYGRDIETLLSKTKIAHSRRVFCLEDTTKKTITIVDLNKGLDMFLKNEDSNSKKDKEDKEKNDYLRSTMYL